MSELMLASSTPRPDHLLDPDESLIWWDSPYPRYYAQHPQSENIPSALFGVVFMMVWVAVAYQAGGYFWLFGLFGLGYSLWLLSEPFRLYREAPSVRYLLTDRRAVIAKKSGVKSFVIQNLGAIELRSEPGDLGDVFFFDTQVSNGKSTRVVRDGFIGIAGADAVAREMRRLQNLK